MKLYPNYHLDKSKRRNASRMGRANSLPTIFHFDRYHSTMFFVGGQNAFGKFTPYLAARTPRRAFVSS